MTTKQVLELTVTFLGKEDLLDCSYFTGENAQITNDEQKELDFLLRCLNLIIGEITIDYLPIYKQKNIVFLDNKIDLDDISSDIFRIVSIKDEFGSNIRFKVIDGKIFANAKNATITYSVQAQNCTLDGNINDLENLVPARVLAYGTAMEYSFISQLTDDATVWENRYKNALLSLSHKKHNMVMPKRRWLWCFITTK